MKTNLAPKAALCALLILFTFDLNAQQGSISPEVKKIDCDKMYPFQEGFAVVQKGKAYGIIDANGEFLVPYGTYRKILYGFVNGLCQVISQEPEFKDGHRVNTIGFINKTGKLAIPFRYSNAENFDKDGYLYAYKDDGRNNSINCLVESNGRETVLAPLTSTGLKNDGIYSRSGKLVCKANFIHVSEFSEGLAAVAKQDEFGQTKWGFIDEQCNTVVPFQFSKMPGKFSQGLAMVTPLSNSGFDYSYIDRTGKPVIKLTKDKNMENVGQSMDPSPYAFNDGNFAISPFKDQITNTDYLLFKTGVHVSYANLLKSNGATFNLRDVAIEECSNSQILFRCRLTKGISSKDGRIIIEPIFNELSSIDPESKLAKAKYSTGNNTYTEGYINEQGVFVIIKGGASTW